MSSTDCNTIPSHDVLVILARKRDDERFIPFADDAETQDLVRQMREGYPRTLMAAAEKTEADTILFVVAPEARTWVAPLAATLKRQLPAPAPKVELVDEGELERKLSELGTQSVLYVLPDDTRLPRPLDQRSKYLVDTSTTFSTNEITVTPWPAKSSAQALTRDAPAWTRHFSDNPQLQEQLALVRTILKQQGNPGVPRMLLITGDTGTGKSYIAKCLPHILNPAFDDGKKEFSFPKEGEEPKSCRLYRSGNCASLSEELADVLLFGAVKGTYTECKEDRVGLLESAKDGILFLDEVGELPLGTQSKLLTVLEEREFYRLGDTGTNAKIKKLECFIVFGTNVNLEESVALHEQTHGEKGFRRDLFNRINAFTLHLPSFYERLHGNSSSTELSELGNTFLSALLDKSCKMFNLSMTERARQKFRDFATTSAWKGNFRDIQHIFQRLRVKLIAQGLNYTVSARLMKEVLDDWGSSNTPASRYPLPEGLPLDVQTDLVRIFDACQDATSCADAGRRYFGPAKQGNISDLFTKHLRSRGYRFDRNAPGKVSPLDS